MAAITTENRAFWQDLANQLSAQRPYAGRRVRVTGGRRKGLEAVVLVHMYDRYSTANRYGGAANLQMREMAGREGCVCKVQPSDGTKPVWIKANHLEVLA